MSRLLHHPFERLSPGKLGVLAVVAAGFSAPLAAVLWVVAEAGPGFESLSELVWAGTPEKAEAVLSTWSGGQLLRARWFAALHWLFVVAFFNLVALGACSASRAFRSAVARSSGALLGWLCWLCVAAEIGETLSLHRLVRGSVEAPWPRIAATSTLLQHLVLYVGALYIAVGALLRLRTTLDREESGP